MLTTSWPRWTGDWAGHFVREEVLELELRGAKVTMLTPRTGPLSAFGPPGALTRIAAFPPRIVSAASWLLTARNTLRQTPFDHVIVHWVVPTALAVLNPRKAHVSTVTLVSHGSDVALLTRLPRRASYVRALLRRATSWRFVSRELMDALARALPADVVADLERIAFIEAPKLHVPDVRERAAELRSEIGPFHASVGRLVPGKRVERAIAHVAARNQTLVVVGDGPARWALERHAARLGANVRFLGDRPRAEALAYIAAADALVLASSSEGCSTVAREAAALSTPILRL